MEEKRIKESNVVIAQLMTPKDTNIQGNVHGGVIMHLIDTAGGLAAMKHARGRVVTASIDRLDFRQPVLIGDLVTLKASVNLVGRTSIEVGVRVESENLMTGEIRHTASAYLTYVALDKESKPTPVPSLMPETEDEIRRNREALARREMRICAKKNTKSDRQG